MDEDFKLMMEAMETEFQCILNRLFKLFMNDLIECSCKRLYLKPNNKHTNLAYLALNSKWCNNRVEVKPKRSVAFEESFVDFNYLISRMMSKEVVPLEALGAGQAVSICKKEKSIEKKSHYQ